MSCSAGSTRGPLVKDLQRKSAGSGISAHKGRVEKSNSNSKRQQRARGFSYNPLFVSSFSVFLSLCSFDFLCLVRS